MEMALRLKRMHNQSQTSNQKMELDDDMQIFYVCKVCKISFEDSQLELYKEHKNQHVMNGEMQAQSTPIKKENEKKKPGRKKKLPVDVAQASTSQAAPNQVPNLYQCRECPQTFRTYMSRHEHEARDHWKPETTGDGVDKNETFPTTKKSLKRLSRRRRSPVPAAKPSPDGKVFTCDTCHIDFTSHKGLYWHRLKTHGILFGKTSGKAPSRKASTKPKPSPKIETTFSCRYCEKVFDKRHSKYNHERICARKNAEEEKDGQSDDSAVVEQPMPEEPIVELTEEDEGSNNEEDTTNVEGPIKCSRCPDIFTSLRARSLHEKNIHNLQPTECRHCSKIFASYAGRYQHEKRCQLNMTNANNGNHDDAEAEVLEDGGESGFQDAFAKSI